MYQTTTMVGRAAATKLVTARLLAQAAAFNEKHLSDKIPAHVLASSCARFVYRHTLTPTTYERPNFAARRHF